MGKVTGFLEFERHDRHYAPVAERIRNYAEFVVPLNEKELREQAARCMNCGIPYCHGTGSVEPGTPGCPANTLCLLNKRFQVTVSWSNQFDGSSGVGGPSAWAGNCARPAHAMAPMANANVPNRVLLRNVMPLKLARAQSIIERTLI